MDTIKPWMHDNEILLILKHLYYTDTMLEWGSGGSTLYFPYFVKHYYSIEHNEDWFQKILPQIPDNVNFNFVSWDSERTIPTQRDQFKTYIEYINELGVKKFDKILIDGRARGWCAEYALNYLHKDSIIFIHDFWNRPQYHIVFEWYNEIDSIKNKNLQTIVALQPKKNYLKND